MTGRSALRTCEDLDETVLQYAEFKALATSDPRVKEKMEVDNEINRLTVLKSAWQTQQNDLRYNITRRYPDEIAKAERRIAGMTADLAAFTEKKPAEFQITIDGKVYEERTKAAEHFMVRSRKLGRATGDTLDIGSYAGFTVRLHREWIGSAYIQLCGKCTYQTDMGESELGNITRIENLAQRIIERKDEEELKLKSLNRQLAASKAESEKPFADGERLVELQQRKVSLDLALEFKEEVDDDMMTEDNGQGKEAKKQPDGLTARLTGIMDRLGGPADQADAPTPRTDSPTGQEMPLTLEQQLYQKLEVLAAPVLDGSTKCMKRQLKPGSFADLEIEDIGDGKYSIAHYYMEYGDIMSDMEIIFKIDKEAKSVHPISFLQTDERIVYDMETAPPEKAMELKQFMGQWLTAINNQCQGPEPAGLYEQDEEQEEYER